MSEINPTPIPAARKEDPAINVALVRHQAKARWLAEQRRKIGFLERIEQSVPWWLVIIAATLFALSAPHTASTFAQLTPVLGILAPLLVEFGLLYAAFERKKRKQRREPVPQIVWVLEGLLFVTAIIVNGAGAFTAVVINVGLGDLSFGDMLLRFGVLPATSQVALVLVPIAALIIPIGTAVAGEGLAALVFERRQTRDESEEQWAVIAPRVLQIAFFDALLAAGFTPGKARQLAASYAGTVGTKDERDEKDGEGTKGQVNGQASLPERTSANTLALPSGQAPQIAGTSRRTRNPNALANAQRLLSENPDWVNYPVRTLQDMTGISKTVWDKAKKIELVVRSNGHGTGE